MIGISTEVLSSSDLLFAMDLCVISSIRSRKNTDRIYKVWFRGLSSYLLLTWLRVVSNSSEKRERAKHVLARLVGAWGACLGSLSRDDDERERHKYLRILNDQKLWFLHALRGLHALHAFHTPHVRLFFFWFICLTSSVKRSEMNKFQVLWRTSAHNAKRLLFKSKLLTRSCHFHALILY